jgi:outer membrane protein W
MEVFMQNYAHRAGRWLTACVLALWGLSGMFAQAETYIAGQVGYTLAQDVTNVNAVNPGLVGLPAGTTVSNVDLNNSLMYGMKLGHYFASTPWLGVELEGFITTPHVPQQQLTLNVPGVGSIDQPGATNRLIVMAPNLVARYQAGAFEPYVGVGPGVFFLHQQQRSPDAPDGAKYSLSSNSKCNTAGPEGLRCCDDKKMLHTLEC